MAELEDGELSELESDQEERVQVTYVFVPLSAVENHVLGLLKHIVGC